MLTTQAQLRHTQSELGTFPAHHLVAGAGTYVWGLGALAQNLNII
jgi:hypothetical protein